jgi:hypothetical protein
MLKLRNRTVEKLKRNKKVSYIPREEAYEIYKSTAERMEKYSREYSRKEKASEIAASKLILNS